MIVKTIPKEIVLLSSIEAESFGGIINGAAILMQ